MPARRRIAELLVLALAAVALPAPAQNARTLSIVVPSGPGSAPDVAARLIADELRTRLGQPTIVENRPGAGGIIAAMAVRNAKPDGNTLLLAQAAVMTVTPLTYRAAVYDPVRDFEAVSVVADTPMLFVANPAKGPKTLGELIERAKASPDTVPVGSPARGSIPHLSVELLSIATGARFQTLPQPGSAQALQAVVSGDTVASVDGPGALLPLVRAGRLSPLAVTSGRALPGMEGVPLARDTVPDLVLSGWFMLFAPKGTPPQRVQAINEAVDAALKSPELVQKLQTTATYPIGGSVADARTFLARELKRWAGAVERAGLARE